MRTSWTRCIAMLGPLALLAACTGVPQAPSRQPEEPAEAKAARPLADVPHKPGPLPTQALNVHTQCSYEDEGGTRARMVLDVTDASVERFVAQVAIRNRGVCNFDLKDFRQTGKLPIAVLNANRGRCAVRVWQQHERVTVAFTDCEAQCTGNAFQYLWPILTDTRDGQCS